MKVERLGEGRKRNRKRPKGSMSDRENERSVREKNIE